MDLSKLKICFLAGTLGQGGAEQQLYYILRSLRQSGASLRVLCLGQHEFGEDRIKNLGVTVTCVGQSKSALARLFRIIAELRKHPPQIFQSQHFYTSAYVGAAARLLRLCSIGALRSNGLMEVQGSGAFGGRLSLYTPQLMVANSQAAIRYATERGVRPGRLYFLPNVVDTEQLKPASRRDESFVHLITVGRLVQLKRFDRFLAVLAKLRKETSMEVRGTIVGGGPLMGELQKQAAALGLLPLGVDFKGSVADMTPIYQGADICVLTSEYEGTPNVLLEAMASGLPVVATNVGGVPGIVLHRENGFLVEPESEDSLQAALARLINDAELRKKMGRNARAFVEANHSLDRLPTMLNSLYQWVLS